MTEPVANAPAPEHAAAPVAAPAAAPAAPAAAPSEPAAQVWTDGLDAASKSFAEARGFKSPAEVLAKIRDFEPPESADKYELPIPEGDTGEFAKAVAPLFHQAGLSAAQAKALAEGWNAMQGEQAKAAQEAQALAEREANALAERQQSELKREWGEKFDANVELSRRALRSGMAAAGLKDDDAAAMIGTLEKAHGFAAVHKFFAALGAPMAEGSAHGLGGGAPKPAVNFYDKSNMNP